jgi:protein-S-isoprenylcysteine O-methyltransferase Ste14
MKRLLAVLGSALFLVIAPGTIAGVIPWWISGWRIQTPFAWWFPLRVLGGLLIAAGAAALLESFARFALRGLGTPAPVFPTRILVVTGLYRYVRNPMYVAVLALVVGQGLVLGSMAVLGYAVILWLGFHVFVLAYEEPTLRATYGPEYEHFCANVRRWIPRLSAWHN